MLLKVKFPKLFSHRMSDPVIAGCVNLINGCVGRFLHTWHIPHDIASRKYFIHSQLCRPSHNIFKDYEIIIQNNVSVSSVPVCLLAPLTTISAPLQPKWQTNKDFLQTKKLILTISIIYQNVIDHTILPPAPQHLSKGHPMTIFMSLNK